MRHHITGIDHCLILVRSLDAAKRGYERMGFTVSPRGLHPPDHGTGNHTIMLANDYVELLGVVSTVPGNERWRKMLENREGMSGIALRTDDADKAAAEMAADGVALTKPERFARPIDLPNGAKSEAAFRTTKFPDAAATGFRLFCCQHLTRENVWLPELLRHSNTAYAIDHVAGIAADPAAEAAGIAKAFAAPATPLGAGAVGVAAGAARMDFMTQAAFAERYRGAGLDGLNPSGLVALALRVRSGEAAAASLIQGGVPFARIAAGLAIAPRDAGGALLVLTEA